MGAEAAGVEEEQKRQRECRLHRRRPVRQSPAASARTSSTPSCSTLSPSPSISRIFHPHSSFSRSSVLQWRQKPLNMARFCDDRDDYLASCLTILAGGRAEGNSGSGVVVARSASFDLAARSAASSAFSPYMTCHPDFPTHDCRFLFHT